MLCALVFMVSTPVEKKKDTLFPNVPQHHGYIHRFRTDDGYTYMHIQVQIGKYHSQKQLTLLWMENKNDAP